MRKSARRAEIIFLMFFIIHLRIFRVKSKNGRRKSKGVGKRRKSLPWRQTSPCLVILIRKFHLQSHKCEPSGCIDTVIRGEAEPEKHLLSENQRGAQKQRPQKTSAKPDLVADGATVPRAVVVCLSQDEKGEEKQGKKQSNAQKTLPKALFFCHTPLLLSAFLLPAFGSPKALPHPNYSTQRFFCQEMRLSQMKTEWKQNARRLPAKDKAERERAGIKSGEMRLTRKIQTAFCPRRRLFPRPPFCGKAHPEKPCAECLTRV